MTDDTQLQTGDDLASQALASATAPSSKDLGEALISLQNIIERNANELDRIKENLQLQRESLKNIFDNDEELEDAQNEVTAYTQQVKTRKAKLQGGQEVMKLKSEIADLTSQVKEIEEALNNHLLNLYKITGAAVFDTSSGEQRKFSVRASLKGKKEKKGS